MEYIANILWKSTLSVVLGALSSLIIVMFVERKRKPKLILRSVPPSDQSYEQGYAKIMRCLRVVVINEELPCYLRWWMRRESAQNCLADIEFCRPDGSGLFATPMIGRWSGSPEAIPLKGAVIIHRRDREPRQLPLFLEDTARLSIISQRDVPAGERELLDIVIRCDDDEDAYGFNNESYQHGWKNPSRKLPKGNYIVRVTVRAAGEKVSRSFSLYNDLDRKNFRLDTSN